MTSLKQSIRTQRFAVAKPTLVLLGVALFGLALRIVHLGLPLWGDEVATWAFARRSPFGAMWRYALHDPTPPLYYAVIHLLLPLLGDTPTALRLPSVVCGVLLLPVLYWGVRSAGFRLGTAVWAVVLGATSSVLVYYAQEARAYAMFALLATLATVVLFRWTLHGGWGWGGVYALTLAALLLTHRYSFFFVAGHMVYAITRKHWRSLIVAGTISGASLLLLVAQIAGGSFAVGGAGDPTDRHAVVSLLKTLAAGTIGMQTIGKLPNAPLLQFPQPLVNQALPWLGGAVLVLLIVVAVGQRREHSPEQRQWLRLLLLSMVVPIALALLAGSPLSPHPQWLLRGLLPIWPLGCMLLASGASRWHWQPLALGVIVAINSLALLPYWTRYTRWDDAAAFAYLDRYATTRDVIVVDPWYMHDFVDYNYHGPAHLIGFDQATGWLDVLAMERSNVPSFVPLPTSPTPTGDIYVFYRKERLAWAAQFGHNRILVYDPARATWRPYADH